MEQAIAAAPLSEEAHTRAFIKAAWPHDPFTEPRVKRWRVAGRTMLLVLLASSALQYYFFDVYLTIMTLPRLTVLAGVP